MISSNSRRTFGIILVANLLLASALAEACHRFYVWMYPPVFDFTPSTSETPQRYGVVQKITHAHSPILYLDYWVIDDHLFLFHWAGETTTTDLNGVMRDRSLEGK
jgi:hypothetical protein